MKLILSLIIIVFTSSVQYHTQSKEQYQISSTLEQILLWPHIMPDTSGSRGAEIISRQGSVSNVSNPRLIVHQPKNPNGTAILVISGGGYAHIELGKESTPVANWLQSEGVTAFELIYRLPQESWKTTQVPFEDAQRAMRIIRSLAKTYSIDPNKIGILGFSAGGHLAGFTAAEYDKKLYSTTDKIDSQSARPNFTGLIYPVISMLPPNNKTHSLKSILGNSPSTADETAYSLEKLIHAGMPPTFLAQAVDDPISPVDNSYLMNSALIKANIPVAMHIFQTGGHGWGLGKKGSPVAAWPSLFKDWVKYSGFWE